MTSKTRPASSAGPLAEPAGDTPANAVPRAGSVAWNRWTARLLGMLILAGWATYGPGSGITGSVLGAPDYLANVAANQTTFTVGAVLMLLNSAAVVGIGALWFPVLRRHSEPVAATYLSTRILEAALCAVGVISLLSLVGVGDGYVDAGAAGGPHFETLGALALQVNDLSYQIGMAALGLGSLFFCSLLYRTRIIPRALAAWGFVGYAIFLAGMVSDVFGSGAGLLLSMPGGLFELVFAGWLIAKGFDASAVDPGSVQADDAAQDPVNVDPKAVR